MLLTLKYVDDIIPFVKYKTKPEFIALNMNNFKLTNLPEPDHIYDAVNLNYFLKKIHHFIWILKIHREQPA